MEKLTKKEFSIEEVRDLLISIFALIIIFAWKPFPGYGFDLTLLPTFILVVIVAFLLHELAHKFMARKFGLLAIYRMWPQGILFGLIAMITPLKVVLPGAVEIYSHRFERWKHRRTQMQAAEFGIVSAFGPLVNILLAIVGTFFVGVFFKNLVFVNAWLALVNLFPIPPLDGSKILIWKPWIWGFMTAVSLILIVLTIF